MLPRIPGNPLTSWRALAAWFVAGFLALLLTWSFLIHDRPRPGPPGDGRALLPALRPVWKGWDKVENIFAFGDSYTATFFDETHEQPSRTGNLFGNCDASAEGCRIDVKKWIQYLIWNHTSPAAASPPLTHDFAVPGAKTVDNIHAGEPPDPSPNNLQQQLARFTRAYADPSSFSSSSPAAWSPDTTLFPLWFGINDLVHALLLQRSLPVPALAAAYAAALERLARLGARAFLLLNVPPVDAIIPTNSWYPSDLRAADPARDLRRLNAALPLVADKIRRRHPDATVFLVDVHAAWARALADPAAFDETRQVRNTTGWCAAYAGGDPEPDVLDVPACGAAMRDFWWFNALHPTQTPHRFTAAVVARDCFAEARPKGYCSW